MPGRLFIITQTKREFSNPMPLKSLLDHNRKTAKREASMTMPDYKKFLVGIVVFIALAAFAIGLTLYSAFDHWPKERAFALYFWVSLFWAFFSGAALFVRVSRQHFWTRFLDFEATWRLKRGVNVDRAQRLSRMSNSRWIPIVFTGCFIGFVVLAIMSAAAFFHSGAE